MNDEGIGSEDLKAKKKFRDEVKPPPTEKIRKERAQLAEQSQPIQVVHTIKKGGWLSNFLDSCGKPADA